MIFIFPNDQAQARRVTLKLNSKQAMPRRRFCPVCFGVYLLKCNERSSVLIPLRGLEAKNDCF